MAWCKQNVVVVPMYLIIELFNRMGFHCCILSEIIALFCLPAAAGEPRFDKRTWSSQAARHFSSPCQPRSSCCCSSELTTCYCDHNLVNKLSVETMVYLLLISTLNLIPNRPACIALRLATLMLILFLIVQIETYIRAKGNNNNNNMYMGGTPCLDAWEIIATICSSETQFHWSSATIVNIVVVELSTFWYVCFVICTAINDSPFPP